MLPGQKYSLKSVRPYSMKDNSSSLVPKVYGVQKNLVITPDNITNPLINNLEAGLTSEDDTTLEMTGDTYIFLKVNDYGVIKHDFKSQNSM